MQHICQESINGNSLLIRLCSAEMWEGDAVRCGAVQLEIWAGGRGYCHVVPTQAQGRRRWLPSLWPPTSDEGPAAGEYRSRATVRERCFRCLSTDGSAYFAPKARCVVRGCPDFSGGNSKATGSIGFGVLPRGVNRRNTLAAISTVPLHSEMIAPPDSDLMSPPLGRGLAGYDCCHFVRVRCQAFPDWVRRMLSPVRSIRWAL